MISMHVRSRAGLFLALAFLIAFSWAEAGAAEQALWLRYPSISPDGSQVAFAYQGDIYVVSSQGGIARPVTLHPAYDSRPIWSPDGKSIAFTSSRHGNDDIFVMPAAGGEARRLTFHSSSDEPASFTPDGKAILFSSARLDAASSAQFPTGAQPELYRVSLEGGMPTQVLTTPARDARYDSDQRRLVYTDRKGYEMDWRKHDDSSFARDVWIYDVRENAHTRLTAFGADDRQPVFAPGEESIYYLSERSGSFNVWTLDLDAAASPRQVTSHEEHPVRFLSIANDGALCYGFDGEIYVRAPGADESRLLEVRVAHDGRHVDTALANVAGAITEFELSPDGKEIAFIARGEVFVTAVAHGDTRRITDTPEQERSVSFSSDGRTLLYAGEREGSWNLYTTSLADESEPHFFNATALEEKTLLQIEDETFQPRYSPDGKEVAFLANRVELRVLNVESGETRVILPARYNYSYSDGDQWYEWSPDGRWFLVEMLEPTRYSSEAALVSASGGADPINLTESGYYDFVPRWIGKGEGMIWYSDRHGTRVHAGWPAQFDVYAAFFTQEAYDRFRLSEVELEQLKEREKKEKEKEKEKKEKEKKAEDKDEKKSDEDEDDAKDEGPKLPDPVDIEVEGLEERSVRLTIHSASMSGARLTPDGEALLYLARFEKGFDLWKYEHRKQEIKLLAKLNAKSASGPVIDAEGKTAFVEADGRISAIDIASGAPKPVALQAEIELDAAAERAYFFEHAWRQTKRKFYDVDMHGVDWDFYKKAYARFLPHIENNRDMAELISELQGELNASHTGGRYLGSDPKGDSTAALGFFPDLLYEGEGVKIHELIEGGPLQKAETRIEPGTVILAIDGEPIEAGANWYPLLNRKAGEVVRLRLRGADDDETWEEKVKAISWGAQGQLVYERWVRTRRELVERLSDGRLGYAHIRGMSDGPYRQMFEEVFGKSTGKDGLVLDTRFNGGGNLVEALTVFLSGKTYFRLEPRGQVVGYEPGNRWTKPSIVVMNEGNYSDAHCFPVAYTTLGLGETVGMQVPGTCTSVWWERLQDRELVFGIPMIGIFDLEGDVSENKHLDPDHPIDNDPALEAVGRDQQIEKAVEVLLGKLPR